MHLATINPTAMNAMALNPLRRALLLAGLGAAWNAQALPAKTLVFPRDHGSHPDFRTEWWYLTGHATSGERALGFQVTFFRSRVAATQDMKSKFIAAVVGQSNIHGSGRASPHSALT